MVCMYHRGRSPERGPRRPTYKGLISWVRDLAEDKVTTSTTCREQQVCSRERLA